MILTKNSYLVVAEKEIHFSVTYYDNDFKTAVMTRNISVYGVVNEDRFVEILLTAAINTNPAFAYTKDSFIYAHRISISNSYLLVENVLPTSSYIKYQDEDSDPFTFNYCAYRTAYDLLKKKNPDVQLTSPYEKVIPIKFYCLHTEEMHVEPVAHSVNKVVDITPITDIPELNQSSTLFFLTSLFDFEDQLPNDLSIDIPNHSIQLLHLLHLLMQLNLILMNYSCSNIFSLSRESPFDLLAITPVEESAFVNIQLSAYLNELLQNSCVVVGKLVPEWINYVLNITPFSFSFVDRISYL